MQPKNTGQKCRINRSGSAHHRLAWIHPFWDGNGRATRLHTQYALDKVLDTHGLWSVSRGFARKVDEYKGHLQASDSTRQGDTDGRGHLSTKSHSLRVRPITGFLVCFRNNYRLTIKLLTNSQTIWLYD
jgi:hypothetical protein